MDTHTSQAKSKLDNIPSDISRIDQMLEVAAIITELMENYSNNNIVNNVIIVGGLSMEIYTDSFYTTYDIDVVTSASIKLKEKLLELGFTHESRVYIYERLEIALDIPNNALDYSESYERLVKLELENNKHIYVISIEEIILDRAEDWEYADNQRYCIFLLTNRYSEIDIDYIRKELKSRDKEALTAFNKWVEIAEETIQSEEN